MGFSDVVFLLSRDRVSTTCLKTCSGGEGLGTTSCLKTVVEVKASGPPHFL